jgi:hypothetical protein
MPRHELVNAALCPAVNQARERAGEVDLRIDAVQLARSIKDAMLARSEWLGNLVQPVPDLGAQLLDIRLGRLRLLLNR